jgi:hypothetical protein
MSDAAYQSFEQALREQHNRNEARRIRTRVSEARLSPHTAGLRWPFELLQNAIDTGPRNGNTVVSVQLIHDGKSVIFNHDGAPFTSQELAALLSGGSSKEFESEETTGRFGTGFLVTHVLAERTSLQGLLAINGGHEVFSLTLDRTGDEDAILDNIWKCYDSIRAAEYSLDVTKISSASFSYKITDDTSLILGFEAFRRALPYLFATRKQLGPVILLLPDRSKEIWTPNEEQIYECEGGWVQERRIEIVRTPDNLTTVFRVLRITKQPTHSAGAVVVLRQVEQGWQVCIPNVELPRVFREYPIRTATFLPINFVLDGKFSVDQERSRILMDDADKQFFKEALSAAAIALKLSCKEKWGSRHWLAKSALTNNGFDSENSAEKNWWKGTLEEFARDAASLPIVETKKGCISAVAGSGDRIADFIVPRLLPTSTSNETTIARLWPLIESTRECDPPLESLAEDWSLLAEGWSSLGLQLNRISVKDLGVAARQKAKRIDQLQVDLSPVEWLARYIDIVGECWKQRDGVDLSVLQGLLPNQNGALCSPEDLKRDAGVSKELKDISFKVGLDIRAYLLSAELYQVPNFREFLNLSIALNNAVPQQITEEAALEEVMAHTGKQLPVDSKFTEKQKNVLEGSVKLLDHVFQTKGESGNTYAKRFPFLTEDLSISHWSKDRMLMSPKSKWHPDARPFAMAYPEGRMLVEVYGGNESNPDVIPALIIWGICYGDPLVRHAIAADLKGPRLAALAHNPATAEGITVTGNSFVQIALLQPEVLNRCQEGRKEAQALLGLALCYMARHDSSWQDKRSVTGRKGGEDKELILHGALWLADLTYRAWVPVPTEDDKFTKTVASQTTLKDLIEPAWLAGNDPAIALLSERFKFDRLELRLLGIAPDASAREELRDELAKLVELAGGNPATYETLTANLAESQKRAEAVAKCRRIGFAIQEAVKKAIEARGLKLTLVDKGFDYKVEATPDDLFNDAGFRLQVGSYLLEVKATTHGDARLTPLQAQTASTESNRYAVCVVDLRDIAPERLEQEWTAEDVYCLAKIVTNIGGKVKQTCVLVDMAKIQTVGIRNETALRYVIPTSIWTEGCDIDTWIGSIATQL